jgi:hypothetical protein
LKKKILSEKIRQKTKTSNEANQPVAWNSPFNVRRLDELKKRAQVFLKKNTEINRSKNLTDAPDELN